MNEQQMQQAFIEFLAQKYQLKSERELEAKIQELGEKGLKAEYAEFQKLMYEQQSRKMMFGAKLNYIKGLRGQCPVGTELRYYKVGGKVCAKCEQLNRQQYMYQDPIEAFKCGRRMKKTAPVQKKLKGRNGLKTPYKSELGYTQDRGGGVQYVHRVYPENDSYYIDVQYNDEGLYPNRAKKFIYNPTGAEFNYDDYDYSKTVPAKRYDYYKETSPGNWETIKEGQYEFFDENGNIDPNITGGQQIEYLRKLNMPLVEPKIGYGNLPRGYKGQRIYK